jgi:hypothetical protein
MDIDYYGPNRSHVVALLTGIELLTLDEVMALDRIFDSQEYKDANIAAKSAWISVERHLHESGEFRGYAWLRSSDAAYKAAYETALRLAGWQETDLASVKVLANRVGIVASLAAIALATHDLIDDETFKALKLPYRIAIAQS